MLTDRNENGTVEREAILNMTLKGFNFIDMIKDEIEEACPGIVSCSDILVLATRGGIVLAGGLYYPVLTGRRDSKESFFDNQMEISVKLLGYFRSEDLMRGKQWPSSVDLIQQFLPTFLKS